MKTAIYTITKNDEYKVVIRDECQQGYATITNSAEAVVKELFEAGNLLPTQRLLYYDSDGVLDELRHDGEGNFLGFGPGRVEES